MKVLYWVLFIVAVCFCVVGFMGHTAAWGAATLSFLRYNGYDWTTKEHQQR